MEAGGCVFFFMKLPDSVLLVPGPPLPFATPHAHTGTQPGSGANQKGSTLGGAASRAELHVSARVKDESSLRVSES